MTVGVGSRGAELQSGNHRLINVHNVHHVHRTLCDSLLTTLFSSKDLTAAVALDRFGESEKPGISIHTDRIGYDTWHEADRWETPSQMQRRGRVPGSSFSILLWLSRPAEIQVADPQGMQHFCCSYL
jgi:hypothetical protein